MRRIGEVISSLSIPINIEKSEIESDSETNKCPVCKDQRWLRVDVEPGHPNFGRLFPCDCLVRERETRVADELLDLSQLQSLSDLTFHSFDSSAQGVQHAFEISLKYAKNPEGWLFLNGPCGVGKTHLAAAIANEVIKQRQLGVYFRVVPDLLDQLRATFDPTTGVGYDDRFQQIRNAHLLVLDDLGTEQTTPWAREKLYQLINHRYNEQLPMVVTSNQNTVDLEERIVSRLVDSRISIYVPIVAVDYRLRGLEHLRRGKRTQSRR